MAVGASFFAAIVLLVLSVRRPWLALSAFLCVLTLVPYSVYHGAWSIRGPWGAFDIRDLMSLGFVALALRNDLRSRSRADQRAGLRTVAWIAGISGLVVLGLLRGNSPNVVLNDARALLAAVAVFAFVRSANFPAEQIDRVIWWGLAAAAVGILWNFNAYETAAVHATRVPAEIWGRGLVVPVILGGSLLIAALQARSLMRKALLFGLIAAFGVSLVLTQTRGYVAGFLAGLAVLSFLRVRGRGAVASVVLLGMLAVWIYTRPQRADEPKLFDKLDNRITWDVSANSRRLEVTALAAQMSPLDWTIGRGLGGDYDATMAHPSAPWASHMTYTHAGLFTLLLKFGLPGSVFLLAIALRFCYRTIEAGRWPGPLGSQAAWAAGGCIALLVANLGDPLSSPLAMALLGLCLASGSAALQGLAAGCAATGRPGAGAETRAVA